MQYFTRARPVIAAVETLASSAKPVEECAEESLSQPQCRDPKLADIICYLETGDLAQEDMRACELTLSSSFFALLKGILYRIKSDKTF